MVRQDHHNAGSSRLASLFKREVRWICVFLFLFDFAVYSQTNEKTNIEIMQENESDVEKYRASREKEPLTGYDAEANSKKSIKENNERYNNFWVVGGSIGSPSGGNFVIGYYYKDIVLRASGMRYSPNWNGIQGDIGYSFWKTSVIAHSVSLVFGQYNVRPFNPPYGSGDAGQNKYDRDGIVGYNHNPPTLSDNLIRTYITNQDPTLGAYLDYQYRARRYENFRQEYIGITYDILVGGFFLQLGAGLGRGDYRNPQLLLQMGYLFDFGKKGN